MPRLLLNALLGLLALGLAFAAPGEGAARLRLAAADGALSLTNSKDGAAVFRASAMRPGDEASGSVTIGNTGTVPAALSVAPAGTQDAPGAGGGRLSDRLELLVFDVTDVQAPRTVYSGTLKTMPGVALGALPAGAQRTFLFVAKLAPGVGDNAFQGAALTTAFAWSATGAAVATATPAATPVPVPAQSTPPAVTSPPAGPLGADPTGAVLGAQLFSMPSPRTCLSRRVITITVRRPRGLRFKTVTITVNRKTKVKLKGREARKIKARLNLRGLPRGKVVVKIVATTTTRRKAVAKRTFHTCAKR
jgi:spore coat-associated protein N